jgi:hypothetical protein
MYSLNWPHSGANHERFGGCNLRGSNFSMPRRREPDVSGIGREKLLECVLGLRSAPSMQLLSTAAFNTEMLIEQAIHSLYEGCVAGQHRAPVGLPRKILAAAS